MQEEPGSKLLQTNDSRLGNYFLFFAGGASIVLGVVNLFNALSQNGREHSEGLWVGCFFFLFGSSFISHSFKKYASRFAVGAIIVALGLLARSVIANGVSYWQIFGIHSMDSVLFHPQNELFALAPLVWVAVSLLLLIEMKSIWKLLASAICAALAFSVSIVAVAGLISGYLSEAPFGWWSFTSSSTTSVCSVFCVSLFLLFLVHSKSKSSELNTGPVWHAIVALVFFLVVTLSVYQVNMQRQFFDLHRYTQSAANHSALMILDKFKQLSKYVTRFTRRFNRSPEHDQEAVWRLGSADVFADYPSVLAFAKINPEAELATTNRQGVESGHYDLSTLIRAFPESIKPDSTGIGILSPCFKSKEGKTLVGVIVPPLLGDANSWGVVALVEPAKLLDQTFRSDFILPSLVFYVREQGKSIFSRMASKGRPELAYSHPQAQVNLDFKVLHQDWNIFAFPTKTVLSDSRYEQGNQILLAGILSALTFSMLIYLIRFSHTQIRSNFLITKRMKAILDGSTRVGIMAVDLEGQVTMFNSGARRMLGYGKSETVERNTLWSLLSTSDIKRLCEDAEVVEPLALMKALKSESRRLHVGELPWRLVKKKGDMLPVHLSVSQISLGGFVSGFVIVAIDVTKTERQLRSYAKKLESTNKELEEFSYVASHDLKEPVRNLVSYSNLLVDDLEEMGVKPSKDVSDDLFYIKDAAMRMADLVDDLLNLSRAGREALAIEEFPFSAVIDLVNRNLEISILETDAVLDVSGGDIVIQGDKTLLVNLFSNLVSNAVKFVENRKQPRINISLKRQDSYFAISVADNGIGMKKEYLDQIFKPFRRLHGVSQYPGTGIGLSICRKIVERHEGLISVESEVGQGSTFNIELPLRQAKAEEI